MKPLLLTFLIVSVCCASEIKCETKRMNAGDGCNTCTYKLCNDGEYEWDTGMTCTLIYCVQKRPINSKTVEVKL